MRKDIKAINEAFLSVISENTQPRNFDDVMDDVMGLVDRGHINDESQAIDMLTAELGRDLTPQEEQEVTNYFNGTEDSGDIKPTPADKNASWNPRDWEDEEGMGSEDAEESAFSQVDNAETTDAWDPEGESKSTYAEFADRLQELSIGQLKELLSMVKDEIAEKSMTPMGYKPSMMR